MTRIVRVGVTFPPALLRALDELRRVGHHVRVKHVHRVKLAQEPDHLLLGGSVFSQPSPGNVPDLLDRALAVHEADEKIRRRSESLKSAGRVILKHIPQLSPVVVAVNLHMAPQPGLHPRHTVPRWTE